MNMGNDLISSSSSSSGVDLICGDNFEDACSICLEPFVSLDPPSITKCNHEYHLHCILEWSQRSKECPICSQSLVLNDPISQELLAGDVSLENFKPQHDFNPIVHQENELENGPPSVENPDPDFEQRIRQRFAAFTAKARNLSKRSSPSRVIPTVQYASNTTQINGSSSELEGFSESLKSKISSASTRYKESISKSTSGLKEKLMARNDSVKELGRGVQREMNAGIDAIGKMIERLDMTKKRGF